MIRLDKPRYSFNDSIDQCLIGMQEGSLFQQDITVNKTLLIPNEITYQQLSDSEQLYTYRSINPPQGTDPIVLGTLSKSKLIKLYDGHFSKEGKPARDIYDEIKTSSGCMCPYCCGVNSPYPVDHFLPKAHFPVFSVYPENLVPSCSTCNEQLKKNFYATTALEQILHPYFDNDKFFEQQWIYADLVRSDVSGLYKCRFYVKVPNDWSQQDEFRVTKHFELFELSRRYRESSATGINTVIQQIRVSSNKSVNRIIDELLLPGIQAAPYINHWQRGMYMAVKDYLENGNQI